MKFTLHFLVIMFSITTTITSQTVIGFEEFSIPSNSHIKNSGTGSFTSGDLVINNDYVDDPMFPYWSGWILSSGNDTLTEGFTNEHSAISGSGKDNSKNYAVAYTAGGLAQMWTSGAKASTISGFYINNNTYAALSMKNGDAFSKKFGGPTGNDPDFFKILIRGYNSGLMIFDDVDVYLADFRGSSATDYILKDWTYVDLNAYGIDSLTFELSSSDNGAFGMNTPAYFCVDNVTTKQIVAVDNTPLEVVSVTPTMATDYINISQKGSIQIYNFQGSLITQLEHDGTSPIEIGGFLSGYYMIRTNSGAGRFLKI